MHFINPHLPWEPDPSLNPDPNHIHADYAVWIGDQKLDFAQWKYMSGLPGSHDNGDANFEIPDDAIEQWRAARDEQQYLHTHLHLHDGVGHVIHMHKLGLPLSDFFASVGFTMTKSCLTTDTGERYCNQDGKEWLMFVNGNLVNWDPDYTFNDLETILLVYDTNEELLDKQFQDMTDEACLFSKACPWRGDPPYENCIADPEVPCTIPEKYL